MPSKQDLQRLFKELDSLRDRTAFLLFATSGIRRNELLSLTVKDIDLEKRQITPNNAHKTNTTKKSYVTFFNTEAQRYLKQYSDNKRKDNTRIFPFTETAIRRGFTRASKKTGIHITPQVLRLWFNCELGKHGIPDRYVNAFCGHVPNSVIAKHCSDYSPDSLKEIYDKANLTTGVY